MKTKKYIEVIERDRKGVIVGKFAFWGKMTVRMGKTEISINAPGYHDDDNLAVAVAHCTNERALTEKEIEELKKGKND